MPEFQVGSGCAVPIGNQAAFYGPMLTYYPEAVSEVGLRACDNFV